ncbi:MAG: hypothetical protein ACLTDR_15665 [Adlercreutzia equolifaciens]
MQDSLGGIRVVKSFGGEDAERESSARPTRRSSTRRTAPTSSWAPSTG